MRTLAWMARNTNLVAGKPSVEALRRRLVVSEFGADGVEAALRDAAFDETILVADDPTDAPTGVALQVAARVALMERQKRNLSSATIVVGRRRDTKAAAARELVARTLVTHLDAAGGGELVLFAPVASGGERDDLLALVEKLLGELATRSVPIRLQFRAGKTRNSPAHGDVALAQPTCGAS